MKVLTDSLMFINFIRIRFNSRAVYQENKKSFAFYVGNSAVKNLYGPEKGLCVVFKGKGYL